MVDLEKVKKHLRIDDANEDVYLQVLITAATQYVTAITTVENDFDAPAYYDLACLLLVANWYANRESTVAANTTELPHGVGMLITALKPGRLNV